MASKEQLELSGFIKEVHKNLRNKSKAIGPDLAWKSHLEEEKQLRDYAEAMKTLSEAHWTNRCTEPNRIEWTVAQCRKYFDQNLNENYREKEEIILEKAYNEDINPHKPVPCYRRITKETAIKLLDVGSCFNPFQKYENFEVIAIDIAPSISSGVYKMDFTNVTILETTNSFDACHNRLNHLPSQYFDVVVFSLLLEYLPSSEQRIKCVQNAYEVLDNEGLLVIITPDSKHVGANAKLMKNWRYTISLMGFNRIVFEKMEHVTCMIFRKCIDKSVSIRWANLHKEEYMTEQLNIPQDFNEFEESLGEKCEGERVEDSESLQRKEFLFHQLPNVI